MCEPEGGAKAQKETLGEWLMGGRIKSSVYSLAFDGPTDLTEPLDFLPLCEVELDARARETLAKRIRKDYHISMILDDLPVTTFDLEKIMQLLNQGYTVGQLTKGFDVGFSLTLDARNADCTNRADQGGCRERLFVHNILIFNVLVNKVERSAFEASAAAAEDHYSVVGFEVLPCSVAAGLVAKAKRNKFDIIAFCNKTEVDAAAIENFQEVTADPAAGAEAAAATIAYGYSYYFTEASEITWADRWEPFLKALAVDIHWFSSVNSILAGLSLSLLVAVILLRTVWVDITKYRNMHSLLDVPEARDGDMEDTGWKLVSGDVFRKPARSWWLSAMVGCGTHLAATATLMLFIAATSIVSPAARGGFLSWCLISFFLMSGAGGYAGARTLVNISQSPTGWKSVCLGTVSMFFLPTFALLVLLNVVIWHKHSTGGVPAWAMAVLFALWLLVSVPLTLLGGFFASGKEHFTYPTSTNSIPREIPKTYGIVKHPVTVALLSGLLPFAVMYIEWQFIFGSLFEYHGYYAFGFLMVSSIMCAVVAIEMSIVGTYLTLCAEDYHWWWRSLLCGGSVAFYLFIFGIWYLVSELDGLGGGASVFLFLVYNTIISWAAFLALGAMSFFGSYFFTRSIYHAVKAD